MRKIEWRNKALRQLRKVKSTNDRTLIIDEVSRLENFPDCKNVKAIVNSDNLYRLRVKSWRVFFTDQLEIIAIEEVKKRDERTYK
jgi:mRNA interferase RelE/StbE